MLKMAFRNVFRNRRRSLLTAMSLAVAAFVVVASKSYIDGALNALMNAYARLQYGHVLIATDEFFQRRIFMPVDTYIDSPEDVMKSIPAKKISRAVETIKFGGMVSLGDTTLPAFVMALKPDDAQWLLGVNDKLLSGSPDLSQGVVLGKELAGALGVAPGDTLIMLAKTSEDGLGGAKLPVAGVIRFGFSRYDRRFMLMELSHAQKLLRMGDGVTEIMVFLKRPGEADKFACQLRLPEGIDAKSMMELLGSVAAVLRFSAAFYMLFYVMLVALAAFAVVNTMTVAVFERMREIGTLKALGMTDDEIFQLFTVEGLIVGLAGGVAGAVLGYGLAAAVGRYGINYGSMLKNISLPFPYVIYPELSIWTLVFTAILVLLLSGLASAIPSWTARKLTPAEALRVEG